MAVKINGFIEGTQPEELIKILTSLASNWWDTFDTNKLKVVHLSGAMTNVVYRMTWPKKATGIENDERTVLVRIYSLIGKRKYGLLNRSRPMGMVHAFWDSFLKVEWMNSFMLRYKL